jgi:acyl-homoserine-lactone acylase
VVLDDLSPEGPAGPDAKFTLDELAKAALRNEGYLARALRDAVVARCRPVPSVKVPALKGPDGKEALPAASVDIRKACGVLSDWNGRYDLDSKGAVLFREMLAEYPGDAFFDKGALWATAFDPRSPVDTPSGLTPAPPRGPDQALVNLARAVQVLDAAGLAVDVPLGEVQFAERHGKRIPVHGGNFWDGTTNVVGAGGRLDASILDPKIEEIPTGSYAPGTSSQLADFGGKPGYGVNFGTSFLLALHFGRTGPEARAFLTYSDTEDRSDPQYTQATRRFSKEQWREIPLTTAAIKAATRSTETVRG